MLVSEELRQDAKFYEETFLPYLRKCAEVVVHAMALELDKAILGEDKGNMSNEAIEYRDGPWASTGSDSCVDTAGGWHFPGPDVSGKGEPKEAIRIVPLKQGFVVQTEDALGYEDDGVAFTDRMDAAEWLLGWLGFEDEIVESVRDILAGLRDADELVDRDQKLVRAFNKAWNELMDMVAGREDYRPSDIDRQKLLDIARAAQAYVKPDLAQSEPIYEAPEYRRLWWAVKKWRMTAST